MSRRSLYILIAVSVCAFALYAVLRSPAGGIQPKGAEQTVVIAYVSLATGFVSLLTAVVGLLKVVMENRRRGSA
jgi:hypothetical protein